VLWESFTFTFLALQTNKQTHKLPDGSLCTTNSASVIKTPKNGAEVVYYLCPLNSISLQISSKESLCSISHFRSTNGPVVLERKIKIDVVIALHGLWQQSARDAATPVQSSRRGTRLHQCNTQMLTSADCSSTVGATAISSHVSQQNRTTEMHFFTPQITSRRTHLHVKLQRFVVRTAAITFSLFYLLFFRLISLSWNFFIMSSLAFFYPFLLQLNIVRTSGNKVQV
jgi:hypothetical protein